MVQEGRKGDRLDPLFINRTETEAKQVQQEGKKEKRRRGRGSFLAARMLLKSILGS
jgi:hypothetical protein